MTVDQRMARDALASIIKPNLWLDSLVFSIKIEFWMTSKESITPTLYMPSNKATRSQIIWFLFQISIKENNLKRGGQISVDWIDIKKRRILSLSPRNRMSRGRGWGLFRFLTASNRKKDFGLTSFVMEDEQRWKRNTSFRDFFRMKWDGKGCQCLHIHIHWL